MKVIVISDIHGSLEATKRLETIFSKYSPDRIFLLGDILHGPCDSEVVRLLRRYSNIILAVRGNCDYESDGDEILCSLPHYASAIYEGHNVHMSHKPIEAISFPPGDIVMNGHTHFKKLESVRGVIYINPGSAGLPRDECASFCLMDGDEISLHRLDDDAVLKTLYL